MSSAWGLLGTPFCTLRRRKSQRVKTLAIRGKTKPIRSSSEQLEIIWNQKEQNIKKTPAMLIDLTFNPYRHYTTKRSNFSSTFFFKLLNIESLFMCIICINPPDITIVFVQFVQNPMIGIWFKMLQNFFGLEHFL